MPIIEQKLIFRKSYVDREMAIYMTVDFWPIFGRFLVDFFLSAVRKVLSFGKSRYEGVKPTILFAFSNSGSVPK